MVSVSALCEIEHHHHQVQLVQAESQSTVNNVIGIAENNNISAELKRERQRNAELMEKISILEAQLRERDSNGQASCQNTMKSKFKRQKVANNQKIENEHVRTDSKMKHNSQTKPAKYMVSENCIVSWMCVDDTEPSQSEMLKESDSAADFDDTDDSDEDEDEEVGENDICIDHKHKQSKRDASCAKELKEQPLKLSIDAEADVQCLVSSSSGHDELTVRPVNQERNMTGGKPEALIAYTVRREVTRHENVLSRKKHSKIAFCPKEVKKIIESEELLQKNAQSHTIRKIIVFASLGIRHGCDEMYELDFNHFSILRKGEPYVSVKDPGEHVLYENPGVRRKIFYPNRKNPILCPVQILEEEKAMRPSDAGCPSFLFLCIKYGGRTRNIPQNEYVRQRMGRNKLKLFGPAICQMGMLVHIRSGSFFFKALGITLLFMAGFPNDLVQRETKYRKLDLLQKYYRTDEDAEGEGLFLSHPKPLIRMFVPVLIN